MDSEIDYAAFQEFDANSTRIYKDFMSANWAYDQSVSLHLIIPLCIYLYVCLNEIANDPETHSSTFVPIILGSDKTIVSVAAGNNKYYPLYLSIGNVRNSARRAHRDALVLVGFLAIPKGMSSSKFTTMFLSTNYLH